MRALTLDATKKLAPHSDATAAQLINLADNFFADVKLGEHQEELPRILSKVSLSGDADVKRVIGILRGYIDN